MARTKESFLKRIARGVCLSEDELLGFLETENQNHLVWQGAHIPPIKRLEIIQPKTHYLVRGVIKIPQPFLWGGLNPTRILFEHHYRIKLDKRIQLRSACGHTSCISPFHRVMKQTYRGSPVELPELGPRSISLAEVMADMREFEEMYKESPYLLESHPAHLVAEAKRSLGWE